MKLIKDKICLRTIKTQDLEALYNVAYGGDLQWMEWNGPYFRDPVYSKEQFINEVALNRYVDTINCMAIQYENNIIGSVNYYYEDGTLGKWLEIGIVIYDSNYWHLGIGKVSLALWIDYIFNSIADIEHIGFTTWSKNVQMMRLGEKVGMQLEGRIRKVRYWENQYWDSIKYGILREEVLAIQYQIIED